MLPSAAIALSVLAMSLTIASEATAV